MLETLWIGDTMYKI